VRLPVAARHGVRANQSVAATRDRNNKALPARPFVEYLPQRRDMDVNVALFHGSSRATLQQAVLGDDFAFRGSQFAKDVLLRERRLAARVSAASPRVVQPSPALLMRVLPMAGALAASRAGTGYTSGVAGLRLD
jgi:hypothetical protein